MPFCSFSQLVAVSRKRRSVKSSVTPLTQAKLLDCELSNLSLSLTFLHTSHGTLKHYMLPSSSFLYISCLERSMYWSRKILVEISFSLLFGVDPIICFVKNECFNHVLCSYSKRGVFYLFTFCRNVTSYIVMTSYNFRLHHSSP